GAGRAPGIHGRRGVPAPVERGGAMKFDWAQNWPVFVGEFWTTLYIVGIAIGIGGAVGLVLGVVLYVTRRGGLLANRWVFTGLNVLVNFVRPIPFVIFLTGIG